jgi:hypothetical protein
MRRGLFAIALLSGAVLLPAGSAQAQRLSLAALPGNGLMASTASQLTNSQLQFGADIVARTFESALVRSRDAARVNAQPIPDHIRAGLKTFFPDEMLDEVRYTVGDTTPAGLAGFAMRNGNAVAVTLVDTIVFKDEKDVKNLALWAHELHHVEQYREWGVAGFASRYAFGWETVEADARARALEFVGWYRKQFGN